MRYAATLVRGLNYRVHRADGDLAFEHGVPVEIDEATKLVLDRDAFDRVTTPGFDEPGATVCQRVPKFTFTDIPAVNPADRAAKGGRRG